MGAMTRKSVQRRLGCCSCVASVGVVLFVWGLVERIRLDKIMEKIECWDAEAHTGTSPITNELFDLGPGNHTAEDVAYSLSMSNASQTRWRGRTCSNPNQLTFTTETMGEGPVWLVEENPDGSPKKTLVGANWSPKSTFGIETSDVPQVNYVRVQTDLLTIAGMVSNPPSKLLYRSPVKVGATVTAFGISVYFEKTFDLYCGQTVNQATGENSFFGCGDSEANAEYKDLSWTPPDRLPGQSFIQVEDVDKTDAERKRNRFLFGVMLLGIILIGSAAFTTYKTLRQYRKDSKKAAPEPDANEGSTEPFTDGDGPSSRPPATADVEQGRPAAAERLAAVAPAAGAAKDVVFAANKGYDSDESFN